MNLSAGDFDAYRPERASSNAYSRPRIEVKQRAMAWGRRVAARLAEVGIAVDLHGSDEHPSLRNKKRVDCQWIFFWRDEKAREELDRLLDQGRSMSAALDDPSPYTRHAFLALRIDAQAVEVCFAVHPEAKVDVDNLHARLAEPDSALASELTSALRRLPEQFTAGVRPEDRVACGSADAGAIVDMLVRAAAGQVPLWIGWSVAREVALAHAEILDEQLETAILALAPIYGLVAWSRENDHIALDRRLEGALEERARTHAEAEAETQRWRAEREAATARSREQARGRAEAGRQAMLTVHGPPPRGAPAHGRAARRGEAQAKPSLATLFSPGGRAQQRSQAAGRAPAAPPRSADRAGPEDQGGGAPEASRGSAPREGASEAAAAPGTASGVLDKGARVRVLAGPFADKVGVLSELDGRGGARVLLGLLSTRLDLVDLEPVVEGRDRPPLQSSHRRPAAPPPRKAR